MTQEFTLDEIRRLVAIALPDTLYHEHGNVLLSEIDALTARLTVVTEEAATLRVSLDWAVQEADKAFTRVAELEAAMQGLLAVVDTSPGAAATADAVNAARAALGAAEL